MTLSCYGTVGLNFGVLFAWIGISLVTITLFQTFVRRRQVRTWERIQQAEKMTRVNTDETAEV